MKMRKRLIAISLVLGMTAGLAACGNKTNQNGEQNFFLKLSHYRAEGSVADVDINKFADEVNAADDSLEVWVYPAAQLGDYTTVQELVSIGDVEMQFATLGTSVDKYLGITSAPYICSNWDDAYKIFNRDSEFTATIADHLADQNIKLLSVYPLYFGGAIMNKEVDDPASMKNQGIKVRCQTMKGPELVTTMLGYIATPMSVDVPKDLIDAWIPLMPMHRMGKPEELIPAVLYLASDASGYTTGSDIIVDGGYSVQ